MSRSVAYYNENDPGCAAWLNALIDEGEIAYGVVDTRSIEDVRPSDLDGFVQCHFFAGIGVWSSALREAGWSDDRPVWTGSCPCQPFSAAGQGGGFTDERHLWPSWFHLIQIERPDVLFGEQVTSPDGLAWLDLVSTDLDAARYAFGPGDLCSAGFGSPDIRQRSYFVGVADSHYERLERRRESGCSGPPEWLARPGRMASWLADAAREQHDWSRFFGEGWGLEYPDGSAIGRVGDAERQRRFEGRDDHIRYDGNILGPAEPIRLGGVADPDGWQSGEAGHLQSSGEYRQQPQDGGAAEPRLPGPTNGFWGVADWIYCTDGRWRPVEPGSFPLAHGAFARVGRLRGYGNAINKKVAVGFITSFLASEAANFVVQNHIADEDDE